jgi:hypothetical protein
VQVFLTAPAKGESIGNHMTGRNALSPPFSSFITAATIP